jgi:D-serine deaminase-like pyridoxal phosphate-dependent protein
LKDSFEVRDRLEFIVPHVCTTINLHDLIVGVLEDRVEELWEGPLIESER